MLALLESGLARSAVTEDAAHDSTYYLRKWLTNEPL
jgi:hypothetical protein